jgi:hypothetical protein
MSESAFFEILSLNDDLQSKSIAVHNADSKFTFDSKVYNTVNNKAPENPGLL